MRILQEVFKQIYVFSSAKNWNKYKILLNSLKSLT